MSRMRNLRRKLEHRRSAKFKRRVTQIKERIDIGMRERERRWERPVEVRKTLHPPYKCTGRMEKRKNRVNHPKVTDWERTRV